MKIKQLLLLLRPKQFCVGTEKEFIHLSFSEPNVIKSHFTRKYILESIVSFLCNESQFLTLVLHNFMQVSQGHYAKVDTTFKISTNCCKCIFSCMYENIVS